MIIITNDLLFNNFYTIPNYPIFPIYPLCFSPKISIYSGFSDIFPLNLIIVNLINIHIYNIWICLRNEQQKKQYSYSLNRFPNE